ncbi:hypothetical protein CC2G_004533 [Coprinopsis cinerea AmutBmut pab1-1]|nr:hypothetical protein CC2G_004533 [Coprinopsis cinerea AmutBmut pab1-1]
MKGTFSELWIELRKKADGAGFLLTRGRGRMVCSSWTLQFVNRDKRRRWIDPGGCAALDEHAWIETKGPPGRVIDLGTLVHS